MAEEQVSELDAQIAGQKFSIKSASLNTIATVATLLGVILLGYVLWQHKVDAKDQGDSLNKAINAMIQAQQDATSAHRETNCLIGFAEGQREQKAEFCKRISR